VSEIGNKITEYINSELLNGAVAVDRNDDLLASGLVDSFAIMWLVAFVEEQSGLTIPADDLVIDNFRTVVAIENYLESRSA
jgi:acyl carrier protein